MRRGAHPDRVRVHHSRAFAAVLRPTLSARAVHSSPPVVPAERLNGACPQTVQNNMARSARHPENHLHRHLGRLYLHVAADRIRAGGTVATQSRALHALPRAWVWFHGGGRDAPGWLDAEDGDPRDCLLPARLRPLQS